MITFKRRSEMISCNSNVKMLKRSKIFNVTHVIQIDEVKHLT